LPGIPSVRKLGTANIVPLKETLHKIGVAMKNPKANANSMVSLLKRKQPLMKIVADIYAQYVEANFVGRLISL